MADACPTGAHLAGADADRPGGGPERHRAVT